MAPIIRTRRGVPISAEEQAKRQAIADRVQALKGNRTTTAKGQLQSPPEMRNGNFNKRVPPTGMVSPADMKIIQLETTNACPKACSNCTRLVVHQKKPFMMTREELERCLASMEGFPGMLGYMGGEPTIHPDFDWMVRRYREVIGNGHVYNHTLAPVANYGEYYGRRLASTNHKRGLWTFMGPGYYKHFDLIQETFPYQCINDHTHDGLHQALLLSYKDLDIPYEKFLQYRDNCWLQRLWSASVTPWGTYFCEVAAAIDKTLYDGKHAWPVEKGWWQRKPCDFGDQLKMCEHCSACLPVPRRQAKDDVDDISASNLVQLELAGSPAVKRGQYAKFEGQDYSTDKFTHKPSPSWYMEQAEGGCVQDELRIGSTNRSVYPRNLTIIVASVGRAEQLALTIGNNIKQADRLVVATASDDEATRKVATDAGATVVLHDGYRTETEPFNKGRLLNAAVDSCRALDWVLFTDADVLLPPYLRERVMNHVWNNGCLYWTTRYNIDAADIPGALANWNSLKTKPCNPHDDQRPWGYFQLWHPLSQFVREKEFNVSDAFPTAGGVDHHFALQWPSDRRVRTDEHIADLFVAHLRHGRLASQWTGTDVLPSHWRCVGWFGGNGHLSVLQDVPTKGEIKLIALDTTSSRVLSADSCVTDVNNKAGRGGILTARELREGLGHLRAGGSTAQVDIYWREVV